MNDREMDMVVLNDGLKELDIQVELLKSWAKQEVWGEVYARASNLMRLSQGIRRVALRLHKSGG